MSRPVEYLDLEDLQWLAHALLGDALQLRDAGLLGSAAARPQTTLGGEDAYPDIWTKAAALLQSLLKDHALVDGNKRLGWLATATFVEVNGVDTTGASNDAVYRTVMRLASGSQDVDAIAKSLRQLVGR